MAAYEVRNVQAIYKGLIFDVARETICLPNGKDAQRDMIYHRGAAAIVPVMADGRVLLVRQYREAARKETWEIPAGKLDPGEDPEECGKRELEEETGYRAEKMRLMTCFYPAIGYSTEVIYLYLAEALKPGKKHPDEDEFLTVEAVDVAEACDMIASGDIIDGKTITALLMYERMQSK